ILAKNLMTSVNVDSGRAEKERAGLMDLALQMDEKMKKMGRRCLICGGHGAVSTIEDGRLATHGAPVRYVHEKI
ncbi:MAG TPA: MBL fold metallo-hydrolase, partial [Methanomassiliicoccales archaeon]|nr:MBL fold metallo-hydrolase [Methanomassiliicoccales archaeon]